MDTQETRKTLMSLAVHLHGRRIGTLQRGADNDYTFAYSGGEIDFVCGPRPHAAGSGRISEHQQLFTSSSNIQTSANSVLLSGYANKRWEDREDVELDRPQPG